MAPEASRGEKLAVIAGMLFFGTTTVVFRKLLYDQQAVGDPKYGGIHNFNKPWFLTTIMFAGMALALIVYEIERCIKKRVAKKLISEEGQLLSSIGNPTETQETASYKKMFWVVCAPAFCDILATVLGNVGLLFIEASIWQMLRGSMVIFSTLFSHFILKRYHYPYMWWSIVIVIAALIVVGLGAVLASGIGKAGVSTANVIFAIFLTIAAQLFQASQIVVEEFLLHEQTASPVMIVGLEGMWGALISGGIFMPIAQFAFPNMEEGNGIHEDTWDSLLMCKENPMLILFSIMYLLVNLGKNLMGMFVIKVTSAVMRTILEGLRTLFIWIFNLIMYYSMEGTTIGNHHPDLGEDWNKWSWMELGGFALLFTGMLTYNRILLLPGFKYPDETKPQVNSLNTVEEKLDMKTDPLLAQTSNLD
ncbi:hypothetical protein TRFO_02393 [Tritrichomonas foetus]|uniref:Integral membrane protein n=1 Tax=Tritrichomonas foetus TaxID=1144522 RepID=A0A1J4J854_9EUKA|nr:hypothetical protein TRFO_02393 [Tritrichomonas foetus]|eukprot:OHS93859.1 hypothetical protein TRFO_02393 [Tritrichomonas foetus]